ncbi:hypothetical protein D9611_011127 [Ephemerocybe angulata]|uniref:CFEM domain-containing protein n=1 Tax=Ephemerocybe angulata TaxID=980116 RepID=A0A8H5CES8_9AGAR|nr:hypothetical protein D9611_011127 [Tulosesus angulatus]
MRFSAVVALLGAAASVSAASISARQAGLPACAATCLTSAPVGDCKADDNACLCKNEPFVTAATSCIESTCKDADLQTALGAAQALCAAEGVTLTPPTGSSTSATTSTTPAGSSTTSPAATTSSTTKASTSTTSTSTTPAASATGAGNGAMSNGISAAAGIAAIALAAVAL